MPAPTTKIANFGNLLQELTEKSLYGYRDIHTVTCVKGVNICSTVKGILYDSHDTYYQVVREAEKKDNNICIHKYYGNNEDSRDENLDSRITVKMRDCDTQDPHIDVEVGGNGCRALFQIRNGECKFCAILSKKE